MRVSRAFNVESAAYVHIARRFQISIYRLLVQVWNNVRQHRRRTQQFNRIVRSNVAQLAATGGKRSLVQYLLGSATRLWPIERYC